MIYYLASRDRQTRVVAPNSTACYDIPTTQLCTSLTFVLALDNGIDSTFCPIHNSTLGWSAFRSCIDRLESGPKPYIFSNGSVCFIDPRNQTIFHFQCSTEPCSDSCFVRTIISSQRIIIAGSYLAQVKISRSLFFFVLAGPPSKPNITYSDSSLCFSSYSHKEYPVKSFTINISDITGVPTNLTGTYITSGPLCLNVTSNPIPDLCLPFQTSASASNIIGMNSSSTLFPIHNGD